MLKKKKPGPAKGTGGRPPKDINWKNLDIICSYKMSLIHAADILGVSPNILNGKIKDRYDCTYSEHREKKMSATVYKLVRNALRMALEDNNTAMNIFCLKNLAGWADNPVIMEREDDELDYPEPREDEK